MLLGQIAGSCHMAGGILLGHAGVDHLHRLALVQFGLELGRRNQPPLPLQRIGQHHAGIHDRVFGSGKRRRIRQVQVKQILGLRPKGNGGHQHVQPLIHAGPADDLGPQHPAGRPVGHRLDDQLLAVVILRLVRLDDMANHCGIAFAPGFLLGQAGLAHRQVKHFKNTRPQPAAEGQIAAGRLVAGNAAHLVGGRTQRTVKRLAGQQRIAFRTVAAGINVLDIRLQPGIDLNSAGRPQRDARPAGQLHIRPDAGRQNDQIGSQLPAALQHHFTDQRRSLQTRHRVLGDDLNPLLGQIIGYIHGHIRVQRRHDVLCHFHHAHPDAPRL
jgi:hypothetical protein